MRGMEVSLYFWNNWIPSFKGPNIQCHHSSRTNFDTFRVQCSSFCEADRRSCNVFFFDSKAGTCWLGVNAIKHFSLSLMLLMNNQKQFYQAQFSGQSKMCHLYCFLERGIWQHFSQRLSLPLP
jgi:hypothetical protein